jgi:hypothetical protein
MQALAAGGLAEGREAELLQPLAQLERALDHLVEADVRRGIEIEHQPARQSGVPGWLFQGCSSVAPICATAASASTGRAARRACVAAHLDLGDESASCRHGVALEEVLVARCRRACAPASTGGP